MYESPPKPSSLERFYLKLDTLLEDVERKTAKDRAKATAEVLSGIVAKALEQGIHRGLLVDLFAQEMGISRRSAANVLRPHLRTSAKLPLKAPDPGQTKAPPRSVEKPLTSGMPRPPAVPEFAVASSLPALPPELMPAGGQMPAVPHESEYSLINRPDGMKCYEWRGDRYAVLPGMDRQAPYGRYVDGRPMNEWGSPVGDGPTVRIGKNFIGEPNLE